MISTVHGKRIGGTSVLGLVAAAAISAVVAVYPPTSSGASLDESFGDGGIVWTNNETTQGKHLLLDAQAVQISPDGHFYVLGNEHIQGQAPNHYSQLMAIARYSESGELDPQFGNSGIWYSSETTRRRNLGFGQDLALDAAGRLVPVGLDVPLSHVEGNWTDDCAFLTRLETNGAFDFGFGNRGVRNECLNTRTSTRSDETLRSVSLGGHGSLGLDARSVIVTNLGEVLAAGMILKNKSHSGPFVARFRSNGSLDRTFGLKHGISRERGIVEVFSQKASGAINDVQSRSSKVLVAGELNGDFTVVRMTNQGTLDRTFSGDGLARFDLDGNPNWPGSSATGLDVDRHGRIVIVGQARSRSGTDANGRVVVMRLLRNGRLDESFNKRGFATPRLPWNFEATGLAIQKDGRIVVSGSYISTEENDRFALLRFTRLGQLDSTFFSGGVFAPEIAGMGGTARDVTIDSSGRLVAVGGSNFMTVRILP